MYWSTDMKVRLTGTSLLFPKEPCFRICKFSANWLWVVAEVAVVATTMRCPDCPVRKALPPSWGESRQQTAGSWQLLQDPVPRHRAAQGHALPQSAWVWGRYRDPHLLWPSEGQHLLQALTLNTPHPPTLAETLWACPILLPPLFLHRGWSLINLLYPSLHLSFCSWRTQPAIVVHKYGKIGRNTLLRSSLLPSRCARRSAYLLSSSLFWTLGLDPGSDLQPRPKDT